MRKIVIIAVIVAVIVAPIVVVPAMKLVAIISVSVPVQGQIVVAA